MYGCWGDGGWGGFHHIQITLGPSMAKRRGEVSGIALPWQGANPRMFAQLGFARPPSVRMRSAKAVSIANLKPHTHQAKAEAKHTVGHAQPLCTLGL